MNKVRNDTGVLKSGLEKPVWTQMVVLGPVEQKPSHTEQLCTERGVWVGVCVCLEVWKETAPKFSPDESGEVGRLRALWRAPPPACPFWLLVASSWSTSSSSRSLKDSTGGLKESPSSRARRGLQRYLRAQPCLRVDLPIAQPSLLPASAVPGSFCSLKHTHRRRNGPLKSGAPQGAVTGAGSSWRDPHATAAPRCN